MDNECFTALHITVRDSYTSIIRGLLKHGSDANFGTSDEMDEIRWKDSTDDCS